MPLGEWLNTVILQQADDDGVRPSRYRDDEDSYGSEDMSSVHERLDDIASRIEKMSRTGPAAYAPKHIRREQERPSNDQQIAQLIARLDQRLEQFVNAPHMMSPRMMAPPLVPAQAPMPGQQPIYPAMMAAPMPAPPPKPLPPLPPLKPMMPPGLDRAIAEIAAKQRALNGQKGIEQPPRQQPQPQQPQQPQLQQPQLQQPQPAMAQPVLMPVPSQDLSGLEEHLRQITDQIETLRRPGVEDAINALREELGEIGQALSDAMPRQAIDAIERQIQGLTQRIAEGRQNGRDAGADAGALSGIEHGLAEVRDVLRGLTPAENLVGFNEAVDGLAHKIDMIVAQKDPETLGQLERAITTLREMAGHVASNEAVGRLAAQVQELGERVEHFAAAAGGGDALNNLEHRISALADALAERTQSGATVPPRLEALVESLSDKIEQIQQSRGGDVAASHLEDQIVALVQRLDASDSRLGHLEAIERGLADLLVHIEEMRAGKTAGEAREEIPASVIDLKQDIARTQDALNAVHGTLGLVVDRLATIEHDVRAERRAAPEPDTIELDRPFGKIAARVVSDEPLLPEPQVAPKAAPQAEAPQPVAPPPAPKAAPAAPQPEARKPAAPMPQPAPPQPATPPAPHKRLPPAARLPINPHLPPDQPLEPGSGPPAMRASARIAASEAALGGVRPAAGAEPATKSGFIAAARRAAQAALATATPRAPKPAEPKDFEHEVYDEAGESKSLRQSIVKRFKSLFIAASLVAITIGSIQIIGNILDIGGSDKRLAGAETSSAPAPETTDAIAAGPRAPNKTAGHSLSTFSPPILPGYMTPAAPPAVTTLAGKMPSVLYPKGTAAPSLLNPPALNLSAGKQSANETGGDVTGSITRTAAKPRTATPTPPQDAALPAAIGSAKLRNAAIAGDAAAAYEVATRFAEGRGVPADPQEAAHWYERAALKGLAPAEFRYASLLEKGIGVKKNLSQARKLYQAAASKGHAKAMHNLAVLYAEGIDGRPDYPTAVQWFRKAANHGIADSQYNLGVLCARGLGTEQAPAESYKWFALAAKQGDREAAKKRDEMATHLDPDTLAALEGTVNTFVAEPQPHAAIDVPSPQG